MVLGWVAFLGERDDARRTVVYFLPSPILVQERASFFKRIS